MTSFLQQGTNTEIQSIPRFHKDLAEMIDKTYEGSRENVKGYRFMKSLNIDNTLKPVAIGLLTGGIAEAILPRAFTQIVRQRVGEVAPRREFGGFLENLIPMFREEFTTGNYILEGNVLTERNIPGGRFVGERMGRVLDATEAGRYDRITRSGIRYEGRIMRTGSRTFIQPDMERMGERDWFYKPDIPMGIFGVIPLAISYQLGLNNMRGQETPIGDLAPRMKYYQRGKDDIFAIRGTANLEDLAHDVALGGEFLGYKTSLMERKLDIYEKFIRENRREGSKLVITGHSLGNLEMSFLQERIKADETVGFAQPVFAPHKEVSVSYSFDKDPLYRATGVANHKVLKKNVGNRDMFRDYHGIKNYY